ncbi:MAG: TnsD family Tn7-like transposition protein [Anaeromicrobium sp.]|uniref:TnsD family Tn7-like transposition protein n=1 Tax=Anaeromicrobium sp. TaxID=1929132 RepID=UPI0025FA300B|nr:TnsD family Tn7-like transposition protein [Anaeromicrobium sp.]MCT4594726.1 TnsD family Tn7-like transposition protein [Anaeromicrobium sp.]
MLKYFPRIYPEEIFYSVIARYHKHCGNVYFKSTYKDLFNKSSKGTQIDFPNNLDLVVSKLPNSINYTSESIIKNNTLYNCYLPFVPIQTQRKIIRIMKGQERSKTFGFVGMSTQKHLKRRHLFYCPICAKQDYKRFGESYFHRIHQIPGVNICNQHKCLLTEYEKELKLIGVGKYYDCDYNFLDLKIHYEEDSNYEKELLNIANAFDYLLKKDLSHFNQLEIHKKYRFFMEQKDLIDRRGCIKHKDLHEQFTSYFTHKLLLELNCQIEYSHHIYNNWLSRISGKTAGVIEPIRHILFIQFLVGDIKAFFEERYDEEESVKEKNFNEKRSKYRHTLKAFISKFPNTNRSNLSKKIRIEYRWLRKNDREWFEQNAPKSSTNKSINEKLLNESKRKILNFIINTPNCNRNQIINSYANEYKRIKVYDRTWFEENMPKPIRNELCKDDFYDKVRKYKSELLEYLKQNPNSNRSELRENLPKQYNWLYNNNIDWINENLPNRKMRSNYINKYKFKYRELILDYIENNPKSCREMIKRASRKPFNWLYMNDKEWFDSNMPRPLESKERNINKKLRVDWGERDNIILEELKEIYKRITRNSSRRRITNKYLLGQLRPEFRSPVKNDLIKMPKTKNYIDSIVDTKRTYQMEKNKI